MANFWKVLGKGLKDSWNVWTKANQDSWNIYGNFLKGIRNDINGTNAARLQFEQNRQLQKEQQAFNSAEAENDRQFQKEMASTQYQRGVEDLRAAGLNPWLAAQGSGAAAASGATATSSAASVNQKPSGAETLSFLATTAVSAAIIAKIIARLVK